MANNIKIQQVAAELHQAMAAKKCHRCGCFQDTISTLQESTSINNLLKTLLDEARSQFEMKRYDCLGCEVCWPAVAQNVAVEIDPAVAEGSHCATAEPDEQEGWPPLPGDYQVVRFQAPVAVCTLNSDELIKELVTIGTVGLSIVGSLHTENLGIEHLILNILANPYIRFLIVCGEDTRRAIGHLPGQSLVSLMENGVLDRMFAAQSPTALYSTVIEAGIISRLDHAAYLGRELARAENALKTGENYVQDRASGCGCHQNESCY